MKKMVMAVVPKAEAENVLNALVNEGHTATYTESSGGMLRQSQLSLFIAVEEEDLDKVTMIIQENCRIEQEVGSEETIDGFSVGPVPVKAGLGGAVVFIWNLDNMVTY